MRDLGLRDLGFRDVGFRDLGFRDLGFRGLGFRVGAQTASHRSRVSDGVVQASFPR